MRWKKAMDKPVIDRSTGDQIGTIDAFVPDTGHGRIDTIIVGDQLLAWSDTQGIGPDAVIIERADLLRAPGSRTEEAMLDDRPDPLGRPVYTDDGVAVGNLIDIEVDATSGRIDRLILADDDLSGSRLVGVGGYAVMVSSGHRHPTSTDLGSLSKAELYERAKVQDLPGRSDMTKKELIRALS